MTARDRMLSVFLAIGSAHAGTPLAHEDLLLCLCNPDSRRRFNGPPPPEVTFPDEETAALAAAFQNAGRRA